MGSPEQAVIVTFDPGTRAGLGDVTELAGRGFLSAAHWIQQENGETLVALLMGPRPSGLTVQERKAATRLLTALTSLMFVVAASTLTVALVLSGFPK